MPDAEAYLTERVIGEKRFSPRRHREHRDNFLILLSALCASVVDIGDA
jgi:hypothetical protein